MKKYLLGLLFIVSGSVIASDVEIPDWGQQKDKIEAAVFGLKETLQEDETLYKEANVNLNNLFASFNQRKKAREDLFECLYSKHLELNTNLSTCQDDTITLQQEIAQEKFKLESELAALKDKTTKEIADLTAAKTQVDNELASIISTYNSVVGDAEEDALSLISTLNDLDKTYEKMIKERNKFLESVNSLLADAKKESDEAAVVMQEAENKICN